MLTGSNSLVRVTPSPCYFFDLNGLPGKSLADNAAIVLDGAPPQPISVSLAPGVPDSTTYALGDTVQLAVTFDKSVTVDGSSPPVLVLDCTREREALFYGGDGTTSLLFEYEVCSYWQSRFGANVRRHLPVPGVRVSLLTPKSSRV